MDSARIRWIFRPLDRGRIAIMNTRMPMPPSQWVKQRQSRLQWERASMSVRMVEPVVVKPETVSNTASI